MFWRILAWILEPFSECRAHLRGHEMKPYKALVSGANLRYSWPSPGYVVLQKVCIRPGCTKRTSEMVALCPVLLQKPKEREL